MRVALRTALSEARSLNFAAGLFVKHSADALGVRFVEDGGLSQLSLPLLSLRSKYVASESLLTKILTC